jgi:hypothetical protein
MYRQAQDVSTGGCGLHHVSRLMTTSYAFRDIVQRFTESTLWCGAVGILAGLVYRSGSQPLRSAILEMLGEHSAPKTFHFVGVLASISLGIAIAVFGRQHTATQIRAWLCYRPAEVALSLCSLFVGLMFGFGVAIQQLLIAVGALFAFAYSGLLLLVILWLSQPGALTKNEQLAKICAVVGVVSGVLVFWWTYGPV